MKKRVLGMVFAVGALLLSASVASAQMWGYGMGYGMMGPGYGPGYGYAPGAGSSSNLSPDQQAQLDKLREEHFAKMKQLWGEIATKQQDLTNARRAGDQAKVDALTKELNNLYAQRAQEREEYAEQMTDLLWGAPYARQGYGPGYGRGYGPGYGPGYGMGYGMMGPGWAMGYGPYSGRGL
jgi:Spy/CpxP family protein refolding chaperone